MFRFVSIQLVTTILLGTNKPFYSFFFIDILFQQRDSNHSTNGFHRWTAINRKNITTKNNDRL